MSQINKIAMATAAAALFTAAAAPVAIAAKDDATVKCQGINSCKGQSKCATATTACSGQNSCKGQGWLPTATAKECTDKGGTVLPK
jgi:uncharacterized membrane protein